MENGAVIELGDVRVTKSSGGSMITVGIVEMSWYMTFGKELMQYKFLDGVLDASSGEEERRSVEVLVKSWFADVCTPWDEEYVKKKMSLVREYMSRVVGRTRGGSSDDVSIVMGLSGGAVEN